MADDIYSAADLYVASAQPATTTQGSDPAGTAPADPDVKYAPEIQRTQTNIESSLGRSLEPSEAKQLAQQVRSGRGISMQFKPKKADSTSHDYSAADLYGSQQDTSYSAADLYEMPEPITPETRAAAKSVPQAPPVSDDQPTDMLHRTSVSAQGVNPVSLFESEAGFVNRSVQALNASATAAANATRDRWNNPPTQVKLTPAEKAQHVDDILKENSPYISHLEDTYFAKGDALRQKMLADPSLDYMTVSSAKQADTLQAQRQQADAAEQKATDATKSQPIDLGTMLSNHKNFFDAFYNDSMPAHILQGLIHAPADERIAYEKIKDTLRTKNIAENPTLYPPAEVAQAQKTLADQAAQKNPTLSMAWDSLIQSAKENPNAFGHSLFASTLSDLYMLGAPGGLAGKGITAAKDAERLSALSARVLHATDSAITAGSLNTGMTAASNFAAGRPNNSAELMSAFTQGAAIAGPLGLIFHNGAKAKITPSNDPDVVQMRAAYDVATENAIAHPETVPVNLRQQINSILNIPENMSPQERLMRVAGRRAQARQAYTDPAQMQAYNQAMAAERVQQAANVAKDHYRYNNDTGQWQPTNAPPQPGTPKAAGAVGAPSTEVSLADLARSPAEQQVAARLEAQERLLLDPNALSAHTVNGNQLTNREVDNLLGKKQSGYVEPELVKKIALVTGGGLLAATAGATMYPIDPKKGALAAVMLAGLGAFGRRGVGAYLDNAGKMGSLKSQIGAIRLRGEGEIMGSLANSLSASGGDPFSEIASQKIRMVNQYLNKHAGTTTDPLKDIRLPTGERWEDLMDSAMYEVPVTKDKRQFSSAWEDDTNKYGVTQAVKNDTARGDENTLGRYLNHVEDYLRTVPEHKLPQYDLPRAVRETQAWDAANAKAMEKAAAKSMEGMPVWKKYPDGSKWVQLTRSHDFPQESDMMGHSVRGYAATRYIDAETGEPLPNHKFFDEQGKPYPKGYKAGSTYASSIQSPIDALSRGDITDNPEWTSETGTKPGPHPAYGVGTGGWGAIKNGSAKVYSLRDAKGKSLTTVEIDHKPDFRTDRGLTDKDFNYIKSIRPGIKEQYAKYFEGTGKHSMHYGDSFWPWLQQTHEHLFQELTDRHTDTITQIKGPRNSKPPPEAIPHIQDFVRSQKWADVRDLPNADLQKVDLREGFSQPEVYDAAENHYVQPREVLSHMGVDPDGVHYLDPKDIHKAYVELGATENPRFPWKNRGFVDRDLLKKIAAYTGLGLAGSVVGGYVAGKDNKKSGMLLGATLPVLLLAAMHGTDSVRENSDIRLPQNQRGAIGVEKPRLFFNHNTNKWDLWKTGQEGATSTKDAVMQAQRVLRGQEQLPKQTTATVEANLNTVRNRISADPTLPEKTVARINAGDHSVTPETEAILQAHGRLLSDELERQSKIIDDPNTSPAQKAAAQEAYNQAVQDHNALDHATQITGRSWSDAGRQRQAEIMHDFKIRNVLTDARRMKGEDLTPQEGELLRARVADLKTAQTTLQDHLDRGADTGVADKPHMVQTTRPGSDKPHFLVKMKQWADESAAALKGKQNTFNAGINPADMWHLIRIGAYHIANGAHDLATWMGRMKGTLGDKFPGGVKGARDIYNTAKAMDAALDPVAKAKEKVKFDAETLRLQKVAGQKRMEVAAAKNDIAYNKDSPAAKVWRRVLQYYMFNILSHLGIIAKLDVSAVARVVSTPVELGWEQLTKQLLGYKQLAAKSDYSNVSAMGYVKSEIAALKGLLPGKYGADIVSKLKGNPQLTAQMVQVLAEHPEFTDPKSKDFIAGLAGLQRAFGDARTPDWMDHILDMPGRIHDALKTPAERGEFERAQVRFTDSARINAIKSGMTPEEANRYIASDQVQARIQLKSFVKSLEAKFQQDNRAHKALKLALTTIAQEKYGVGGKLFKGFVDVELPIVKTPLNLAIEGTHYTPIVGLVKAGIRGWDKAGEKFTPEDADYILKMLRKQPVGIGLAALAITFYKSFGGIHHEGDRQKNNSDTPHGAIKVGSNVPLIGGKTIPKSWTHYPSLNMMNIAADMTAAYHKKGGGKAGAMEAASNFISDMAGELPGGFQIQDTAQTVSRPGAIPGILARQATSFVVPGVVSDITEYADGKKRYPKGAVQQFESKIPGLRKNVPDHR